MALDLKWKLKEAKNYYQEEEQKEEKNLLFNAYQIIESFKESRFQVTVNRKKDI